MASEDDREYWARRARQERESAASCPDPAIALTHTRMAVEYERRASQGELVQTAQVGDAH